MVCRACDQLGGVATGRSVVDDDDLAGRVVELAQRLEAATEAVDAVAGRDHDRGCGPLAHRGDVRTGPVPVRGRVPLPFGTGGRSGAPGAAAVSGAIGTSMPSRPLELGRDRRGGRPAGAERELDDADRVAVAAYQHHRAAEAGAGQGIQVRQRPGPLGELDLGDERGLVDGLDRGGNLRPAFRPRLQSASPRPGPAPRRSRSPSSRCHAPRCVHARRRPGRRNAPSGRGRARSPGAARASCRPARSPGRPGCRPGVRSASWRSPPAKQPRAEVLDASHGSRARGGRPRRPARTR